MKNKIIFYIIVIISIIISFIYIKYHYEKIIINNNKLTQVSKTEESTQRKIKIYYPITKYKKLNNEIKKDINNYYNDFIKLTKNYNISRDMYYTFYVLYDEYYYKDYISIVLYIEQFLGGAHPDHFIHTINYNTINNEIINISNLIDINNNLLTELSVKSLEKLKENPKFQNKYDKEKLIEGTSPTIDNYKNFALTNKGLNIYFEYYQIAPYYYGYSEVTIPYNEINLML